VPWLLLESVAATGRLGTVRFIQSTGTHGDFSEAGLPYLNLFCEELVAGSADSPLYGSLAELLQTLQPQLEKMRIMPAATIAMEGLESRLRGAVVQARSQIYGPAQVCAWARL
jgi:hypothetical protein